MQKNTLSQIQNHNKEKHNATPWYNFDSHRELLIHSSFITHHSMQYCMCYYNITSLHERAHGAYWPKFHLESFPLFALITCTRTCISLHFLIEGKKTWLVAYFIIVVYWDFQTFNLVHWWLIFYNITTARGLLGCRNECRKYWTSIVLE